MKNPKLGLTIVEVMIGAALGVVVILFASTVLIRGQRMHQSVGARAEFQQTVAVVSLALANLDVCKTMLQGKATTATLSELRAGTSLLVKTAPAVPAAGAESQLTITTIKLSPVTAVPTVNDQTFVFLDIEGQNKTNPAEVMKKRFWVPVHATAATGIIDCDSKVDDSSITTQDACASLAGTYTATAPAKCVLSVTKYPALAFGGTFTVGDGKAPGDPSPPAPWTPGFTPGDPLSAQACETKHPLTNACSCPVGFHPVAQDPTCEVDCTRRWSIRVICVRNDVP